MASLERQYDGSAGESVEVGRRVGAAVPAVDGTLVLATDEGFARIDDAGEYSLLAAVSEDVDDWFLNDAKCDALGRLWAGTVGVNEAGLAAEGAGALYSLELDGRVRRVLDGVSLSNGMDWSPDGETFYYVDSRSGGIDAFAFDLSSGALRDRRRVVELGFPPEVGFVDGLCVDTDGGIWAAVWGFGEVRRYSPAGAWTEPSVFRWRNPRAAFSPATRSTSSSSRRHAAAWPRGAREPAACGQRVLLQPGRYGPAAAPVPRRAQRVSARPSLTMCSSTIALMPPRM